MSRVSVIIPAYNREKTIERAIQSVLDQTYSDLEVIVIDDCSVDNTETVVKSIEDSRLSYYKLKKNSGACVARNVGVEHAKGELIAFQDSDDYWHSDKLEKQISFLMDNHYEFISCGFNRVTEEKTEQMGMVECPSNMVDVWCKLINNNWVSTQTILCYRYCFEKIHFDRTIKRYQDWDLALQAARYYKMGSLNECLVDVYLQADSITNTVKSSNAKIEVVRKQEKYVDFANKSVAAQFYKTMGDVTRKQKPFNAAKYYRKSFLIKPNIKKAICWLGCITGLFRFYNAKQ